MPKKTTIQTIQQADRIPITIETGLLAQQANGAVMVRKGKMMILATGKGFAYAANGRLGLVRLVGKRKKQLGKRKKQLRYLKKEDINRYRAICNNPSIRK